MTRTLAVSIGQHSTRGHKDINQDFHGAYVPAEPLLTTKGIALALADGISSSTVAHIASESAVKGFLEDYYCTSDAWSVKTSAHRVLLATNSWLHAQTRDSQFRYDRDRGYVCTFSALVLKSTTAHVFHVGDARIYRLRDETLEQLTIDHRVAVSAEQSYLARALGIDRHLEVDYLALPLETGDQFLLATDGICEHLAPAAIVAALREHADDLDQAAARLAELALAAGSRDNLTAQVLRVDALPLQQAGEIQRQVGELPLPPSLAPRMVFDGFEIIRQIHGNARSHIFLARDQDSDALVALKTPSIDLREDPVYLERFLMEEWIARRIDNAHVLRAHPRTRRQNHLYVAMEFVEGQTLTQWMRDHPKPALTTVRSIVGQIARGLQAFHRLEMLHQDLRPENIMIDTAGTVRIIDFGSTQVAGMLEIDSPAARLDILGTLQYAAPEYFLGEPGTPRSDLFSLAVITYQMLTGRLPYGAEVSRATTRAAQRKLEYRSALDDASDLPAWVDEALRRALHPLPARRQEALSEFLTDLSQPSSAFLRRGRTSLIERNPLRFWKALSFALGLAVVALLGVIQSGR